MSFASIKIEALNKNNYDTWKIQAKAVLIRSELWGHVSGSKLKPAAPLEGATADTVIRTTTAIETWESVDSKAMSELILTISPAELKNIKNCETSKEVWDKLKTTYDSQGPARKAMLLKRLIHKKMDDGEDMRSHVANFFDVVGKLEDMDLKIDPDLISIILLYSIPDCYESFRVAIEAKDKLLAPESLKVKMIEEYESRKRRGDVNITNAMFVSRNKSGGNGKRISSEKTNHCDNLKIRCFKCKKVGHYARNCGKRNENRNWRNTGESSNCVEVAMCVCKCASNIQFETASNVSSTNENAWCLDSGATSHMSLHKNKFIDIRCQDTPSSVNLASDGDSVRIEGKGTVRINVNDKLTAKLSDALYVPNLRTNLLSVGKMTDNGFEVTFRKTEAVVVDKNEKIVMVAKRDKGLYFVPEIKECANVAIGKKNSWQSLHEKYGHLNFSDLKKLVRTGKVHGAYVSDNEELQKCEVCVQGKLSRAPFPRSISSSSEILELVHTDVCGPMRVESFSGARYFATLIDDKTRYCEVVFMVRKSEIFEKFKIFKAKMENQTGKKIKIVRSDNGREYVSNQYENYLQKEGIVHQLTVEYTPQQNGVAERSNRTLVEMARCMLIQSGLPAKFWAEAVFTAAYIRNRCPNSAIGGNLPYSEWTGKQPSVSHFQTFGQLAEVLDKSGMRGKFDSKTKRCTFIGYSDTSKAYRFWDQEARRVVKSRDAVFMNIFQSGGKVEDFVDEKILLPLDVNEKQVVNQQNKHQDVKVDDKSTGEDSNHNFHSLKSNENAADQPSASSDSESETLGFEPTPGPKITIWTGRPGRPRKVPQMRAVTVIPDNGKKFETDAEHETEKYNAGEEELSAEETAGLASVDPISARAALLTEFAEEWKAAMRTEYDALTKNQTWSVVDKPELNQFD